MSSPRHPTLIAVAAIALTSLFCASRPQEIVLASTTSTEDSGLLEFLLPEFGFAHPEYRIRVIAVGSGEALRLAARGDADVVLAHSPEAELEFMLSGYGASRRPVMFNDFVIVGPPGGAARSCSGQLAVPALTCIAESGAIFISRGDDSGTHAREMELWAAAGMQPRGSWYSEAGLGMGAVLMMASEKQAYTLSDRGTFLSLVGRLHLEVIAEGDPALRNQYSVIVVRGATNLRGAHSFAEWITSHPAQERIAQFGSERFGRPPFTPNADGS